jgi:hypothetical protein
VHSNPIFNMDIFFHDPADIPLPPDEVRLRSLSAQLYPDRRRVRVSIAITPFLKPPSLELNLTDAGGGLLAHTDIIETMTPQLELTLHLRGTEWQTPLRLEAELFYTAPISLDAPILPEKTVTDHTTCPVEG